jgi:hypothetical protein
MNAPSSVPSQDDLHLKFQAMLSQAGLVVRWRTTLAFVAVLGPLGLIGLAHLSPVPVSRLTPTWIVACGLSGLAFLKAQADLSHQIDTFWTELETLSRSHIAVRINLDRLEQAPQITARRLIILATNEIRLDDIAKPTVSQVIDWRKKYNRTIRTKLRGKAPQSSSD